MARKVSAFKIGTRDQFEAKGLDKEDLYRIKNADVYIKFGFPGDTIYVVANLNDTIYFTKTDNYTEIKKAVLERLR